MTLLGLQWRRGLGRVPQVFVVADGGVWIWNLVADRFAEATGVVCAAGAGDAAAGAD